MKPRNKTQEEISRLATYLPGITKEQHEWAKMNCFASEAIRRKNGEITCLVCGHQWVSKSELADSIAGIDCPHCKCNLKVKDSKKRVVDEISYMTIADTLGGYQVLRNFLVTKRFKLGEKVFTEIREVVQTWFDEDGKCIPVAKKRLMCSYRCRTPFSMSSEMDFRSKIIDDYKIWGDVYPGTHITDKLKKRGLTSFYGCNPYHLVKELLQNDCKTETLIKTCQYDLLIAYTSTSKNRDVHWYWNQVKIASRHKYIVNDPAIWLDYLHLLNEFGKDLNNPHFICPDNLQEAHDLYVRKRQKKIQEHERLIRAQEAERMAIRQKEFEKRIKKFLELRIKDEDIEIVPLRSIEEFRKEGEMMQHCVFTNRYFDKNDCLILSARIGDQHIETVELDMKRWQVVQSRGKRNQLTPYHDQIINLVNQNINLIKRIA